MQADLESLLKLSFRIKPLNFGVEDRLEILTGVALKVSGTGSAQVRYCVPPYHRYCVPF